MLSFNPKPNDWYGVALPLPWPCHEGHVGHCCLLPLGRLPRPSPLLVLHRATQSHKKKSQDKCLLWGRSFGDASDVGGLATATSWCARCSAPFVEFAMQILYSGRECELDWSLVALFEWVKSPKWSGGQSGRPAGQPAGPLHDLGLTKVDQCTHYCLLQLFPGGPTHNNLVVAEFSAAISAHGSLWLKKPSVVPLWSDAKDIADLLMISALGAGQPRHPRC